MERERTAALRAGFNPRLVERAPIPVFDSGPALEFPGQVQFHPLRYLAGLAAAVEGGGGRIFVAHAVRVQGGEDAHLEPIHADKPAAPPASRDMGLDAQARDRMETIGVIWP